MYREIIIKDTHRALWYEDGKLLRVLDAGRYTVRGASPWALRRQPKVDVVLVDVRERELTIKGQEILTSDKVAIRVSILVQYRIVDPPRRCTSWKTTKSGCIPTCSWPHAARWRR
ncbi:MAG: SPFH domain-containing protein [Pirellulales bacterium]